MHFAVIQPIKIPRHKAHTIQVMNTWLSMARQGHPCMLLVREMHGDLREIMNFYGLESDPNLIIRRVRRQEGPGPWWHRYVREASRMLPEPFRGVVYTREIGIARSLLRLKSEIGWRVFLELHSLPSALTEELEARAEDHLRRQELASTREQELSAEREVIPSVDGIICISAGLRDMMAERHGAALPPSEVIPNGAAVGNSLPPPLHGRQGIAYVGHLQPNRGVETLINALRYLDGETITLVGGNDPVDVARIEGIINRLGVNARVKMTGCLPPPAAREILLHARVAVMTSQPGSVVGRVFASHTKLFEYMAAGAAIVASDVPTVRPPLKQMKNAVLVPPDDPEEMAMAIRRLMQDDDLADAIARQAAEDVRLYTWDRRASRIQTFISSVLGT